MKSKNKIVILITALFAVASSSCEKKLVEETKTQYGAGSFFRNGSDAELAVVAMYTGLADDRGAWSGGWGAADAGWVASTSAQTDEMVCNWGGDIWVGFNQLNFTIPTQRNYELQIAYNDMMPYVTEITTNIDQINKINMNSEQKAYLIAQLKALRAHYSWILYNFYGPVSIIVDPAIAANANSAPIPRPTSTWMVAQIEKDYKEAIPDLKTCASLPAADYGRFTQDAVLMGLMKLYAHEKRWNDVLTTGQKLMTYGHSLQTNYADVFAYSNKGNSQEILLAISCLTDKSNNINRWLAMCMPGDYVDPGGVSISAQWNGYRMPWKTYDKFDSTDKRLARLLAKWPTGPNNTAIKDARTNGHIGAVPMKYGPDPGSGGSDQGTDIVIWRYADALLLMAEAENELNGATAAAYNYVLPVRTRAGLAQFPAGLSKEQFRSKLMDERLFELWCEGSRREDLIRWGTYVQRAIDDGSPFAKPEYVLYPIPTKAINESNGVIKQNPGY